MDRIYLLGFIRQDSLHRSKTRWMIHVIHNSNMFSSTQPFRCQHPSLSSVHADDSTRYVVSKGIHLRLANITSYYLYLSTNHRLATWASRCERSGDKWELQVLTECASQYVISRNQCELRFQRLTRILQRQHLQPFTGISGCFAAPTE